MNILIPLIYIILLLSSGNFLTAQGTITTVSSPIFRVPAKATVEGSAHLGEGRALYVYDKQNKKAESSHVFLLFSDDFQESKEVPISGIKADGWLTFRKMLVLDGKVCVIFQHRTRKAIVVNARVYDSSTLEPLSEWQILSEVPAKNFSEHYDIDYAPAPDGKSFLVQSFAYRKEEKRSSVRLQLFDTQLNGVKDLMPKLSVDDPKSEYVFGTPLLSNEGTVYADIKVRGRATAFANAEDRPFRMFFIGKIPLSGEPIVHQPQIMSVYGNGGHKLKISSSGDLLMIGVKQENAKTNLSLGYFILSYDPQDLKLKGEQFISLDLLEVDFPIGPDRRGIVDIAAFEKKVKLLEVTDYIEEGGEAYIVGMQKYGILHGSQSSAYSTWHRHNFFVAKLASDGNPLYFTCVPFHNEYTRYQAAISATLSTVVAGELTLLFNDHPNNVGAFRARPSSLDAGREKHVSRLVKIDKQGTPREIGIDDTKYAENTGLMANLAYFDAARQKIIALTVVQPAKAKIVEIRF